MWGYAQIIKKVNDKLNKEQIETLELDLKPLRCPFCEGLLQYDLFNEEIVCDKCESGGDLEFNYCINCLEEECNNCIVMENPREFNPPVFICICRHEKYKQILKVDLERENISGQNQLKLFDF